jgi:hypothetical protein
MAMTETESVFEAKDTGLSAIHDAFEWGRLKLDNRSTPGVKKDSDRMLDDLFGANKEDPDNDDDDDDDDHDEPQPEQTEIAKGDSGQKNNDSSPGKSEISDSEVDDVTLDYDNQ